MFNKTTPIMSTPSYAMYTPEGDLAVHGVVLIAKQHNLAWKKVYAMLCELAEVKEFSEATDTVVRECVYDAIGARNQDFYV